MEHQINIVCKNKEKQYSVNTSLLEISKDFQKEYNYPILMAKVDNDLCELTRKINKDSKIEFFDRSSVTGNAAYASGVHLLMIAAIKKVLGDKAEVVIENSIDKGVYCEILNVDINQDSIFEIEAKMNEMVLQDLTITKLSVDRLDAMRYFSSKNQIDKVNVLKYISNSFVNLYRLENIYDYFFTEMPTSTKVLDEFKLTYLKDNGFVVSYPDIFNPEITHQYNHRKLVFDTFYDYTKWGETIEISTAADLNYFVSQGKYDDIIRLDETHYEGQLAAIANEIYNNHKNIKIVLIAGPSSSGKTTTANKLSVFLKSKGIKPHKISIDDYFVNREDTPKDGNGEYDFESLEAVDLDLFNKDLAKLLDGKEVVIPYYNFVTGKREYKDNRLILGENDVIIIEGLHGLNERLTMSIPRGQKFKIYIGPFTQLNIDYHNRIHTSDTRRLRRIVRDNQYRGRPASETLKMWKKIKEGEEKNIYPFQDDVDAVINSSFIYELGVLKVYAEPLLFSVNEDDETYPEAIRLINFLRNFLPIPSDSVPRDSLLREFIGGSYYKDN